MKPTKTTKVGNLTKQRGVACPTCHTPAGDFCKSVGARGKAAGAVMKTSCHNARIVAAGLTPRDFSKSRRSGFKTGTKGATIAATKAKANRKRSEAMRLSWKRRREASQAVEFKDNIFKHHNSFLIKSAWDNLQQTGVDSTTLSNEYWQVKATRHTSTVTWIEVTNLKG